MDDNYENSVVHDLTFGLDHEDHSSIHDSQSGLHPDEETSSMSSISSLTGFLFGNIDEKGELEEDFLDEVSMAIRSLVITFACRFDCLPS